MTIEPVIQPANSFEAKREIIEEDEIDENCDIPDEDDDMDYDDMGNATGLKLSSA